MLGKFIAQALHTGDQADKAGEAGDITKISEAGPCLEDEAIASYIDNTLDTAQKHEVERHLFACPRCRRLYQETSEIVEELTGKKGQTGRFKSKRHGMFPASTITIGVAVAALLAITLVVVVKGGLIGPFLNPQGGVSQYQASSSQALVDKLGKEDLKTAVKAMEQGGSATRGFASGGMAEKAAFALGVSMTDLQVAWKAGDRDKALLLVQNIVERLEGLQATSQALSQYRELLQKISGSASVDGIGSLAGLARKMDASVVTDTRQAFWVSLGQWTEAGLIASLTGKAGFFTKKDAEYFKKNMDAMDVPRGVKDGVTSIGDIVQGGVFDKARLEKLADQFGTIKEMM